MANAMAGGEPSSVADAATAVLAMPFQFEGTKMMRTVMRIQCDTKRGKKVHRDDGSVVAPLPA